LTLTPELIAILNSTGLQSKDPKTYQVLQSLIQNLAKAEKSLGLVATTVSTGSTTVASAITALTGDVNATGPGAVVSTLSASGVAAGTYGDSTHVSVVTVNAKGLLTAASTVAITFTTTGITQLTGEVLAGPGTGSQVASLSTTGITAGTYGDSTHIPIITFDTKGRATSATTTTLAVSNAITADVIASGPGSVAASLSTTGVTAGTYGSSSVIPIITIDAKGRITIATTASVSSTASGITQLTGDVLAGPGSGSVAATLSTTGVTAGTYGTTSFVPIITVDAKGRITAATTTAIGTTSGALVKLAQITTSASTTQADFTSISGAYSALRITWMVQSTAAGTGISQMRVEVNGDTTSGNYTASSRIMSSGGASAASDIAASATGVFIGNVPTVGSTGSAGVGEAIFPNYTTTSFHKAFAANHGSDATTGGGRQGSVYARYKSTAAITRLTFTIDSSAFSDNCVLTLYGLL